MRAQTKIVPIINEKHLLQDLLGTSFNMIDDEYTLCSSSSRDSSENETRKNIQPTCHIPRSSTNILSEQLLKVEQSSRETDVKKNIQLEKMEAIGSNSGEEFKQPISANTQQMWFGPALSTMTQMPSHNFGPLGLNDGHTSRGLQQTLQHAGMHSSSLSQQSVGCMAQMHPYPEYNIVQLPRYDQAQIAHLKSLSALGSTTQQQQEFIAQQIFQSNSVNSVSSSSLLSQQLPWMFNVGQDADPGCHVVGGGGQPRYQQQFPPAVSGWDQPHKSAFHTITPTAHSTETYALPTGVQSTMDAASAKSNYLMEHGSQASLSDYHDYSAPCEKEKKNMESVNLVKRAKYKSATVRKRSQNERNYSMIYSRSCELARNKPLNRRALEVMEKWFSDNVDHPYPTQDEKELMAEQGGILTNQVSSWFANHRTRTSNTRPKKGRRIFFQRLMEFAIQLEETTNGILQAAEVEAQLRLIVDTHL